MATVTLTGWDTPPEKYSIHPRLNKNLCLDAGAGELGAKLQLKECNGSETQDWLMPNRILFLKHLQIRSATISNLCIVFDAASTNNTSNAPLNGKCLEKLTPPKDLRTENPSEWIATTSPPIEDEPYAIQIRKEVERKPWADSPVKVVMPAACLTYVPPSNQTAQKVVTSSCESSDHQVWLLRRPPQTSNNPGATVRTAHR